MNDHRASLQDAPIPDITLERYRLGELNPIAMRDVDARLGEDAALRDRLDAMSTADDEARQAYPPHVLAAAVRRRVASEGTGDRRRRHLGWLVPLGVAATIAVVVNRSEPPVAWRGTPAESTGADEGARAKGDDMTLVVYRHTESGASVVADGSHVTAGDVVRIGYRVARPGFGAIVSVDGRGVLTQHLPDHGTRAVALQAGGTILLDRSFELDDAPRVERFFLVAAAEPFDLAPVLESIRRTGDRAAVDVAAMGLSPQFITSAFTLLKDGHP